MSRMDRKKTLTHSIVVLLPLLLLLSGFEASCPAGFFFKYRAENERRERGVPANSSGISHGLSPPKDGGLWLCVSLCRPGGSLFLPATLSCTKSYRYTVVLSPNICDYSIVHGQAGRESRGAVRPGTEAVVFSLMIVNCTTRRGAIDR